MKSRPRPVPVAFERQGSSILDRKVPPPGTFRENSIETSLGLRYRLLFAC